MGVFPSQKYPDSRYKRHFFHEVDDDVTDRVFPDFADECGRYT